MRLSLKYVSMIASTAALFVASPLVQAIDAQAAKALASQNNCFKCHTSDKDRDGPSFHKVADKFKGKPADEAETRLIAHITNGEKSLFPDGHEEVHKIAKTYPPNDKAQLKNLVQWILNQ
ncbi:MAG: c-type cytochrome [Burkholderiales bacterium]